MNEVVRTHGLLDLVKSHANFSVSNVSASSYWSVYAELDDMGMLLQYSSVLTWNTVSDKISVLTTVGRGRSFLLR